MLVAVEHVKTGTSRRQQHDISRGSIPPCFSYGFYQIRCQIARRKGLQAD